MKKYTKQFIAVLVALVLVLTSIVFATANEFDADALNSEIYLNPLYDNYENRDNIISEINEIETEIESRATTSNKRKLASAPSRDDYPTDYDIPAANVRDSMEARSSEITIQCMISELSNDAIKAALNQIMNRALQYEFAENSSQGDYLNWSYGGYSSTGSVRYYPFDSSSYGITITLAMTYYSTAEQEQYVNSTVASAIETLGLNDDIPNYQKVKLIYDYVMDTIKYDFVHMNDSSYKTMFTAYGGLHDNLAVCQGYATLTYKMCNDVGIPCRIITSSTHAWNLVYLDDYGNNWYHADTTWDDTAYDNQDATDGNYWSFRTRHVYFLKNDADFVNSDSHVVEDMYTTDDFKAAYPVAEKSFYLYEYNGKNRMTHKVICAYCGNVEKAGQYCNADEQCIYCKQRYFNYTINVNIIDSDTAFEDHEVYLDDNYIGMSSGDGFTGKVDSYEHTIYIDNGEFSRTITYNPLEGTSEFVIEMMPLDKNEDGVINARDYIAIQNDDTITDKDMYYDLLDQYLGVDKDTIEY